MICQIRMGKRWSFLVATAALVGIAALSILSNSRMRDSVESLRRTRLILRVFVAVSDEGSHRIRAQLDSAQMLAMLVRVLKEDPKPALNTLLLPQSDWDHRIKGLALQGRDGWKTPLLLEHGEDGLVRLRSAGQDRIMHSKDDLVVMLLGVRINRK